MTESALTMNGRSLSAKRILVMRYRFIGDTILTVPFLRNLRRAYPEASIDVLVGPQSGSVLENCPYIDQLLSFDTTRFHKYDRGRGPARSLLSYALELRHRQYDTVFLLKRSLSSGLLAWLTGARIRIGYDTEFRRLFLTHKLSWDSTRHEVESTLDLLRAANVPVVDDYLEAFISEKERAEIVRIVPELKQAAPLVLIHAAAAHPNKMYPLQHWAKILRSLKEEREILPFFTGAERDRPLYQELENLSGVRGVNLAGQLSLRQSLALYEQMHLAICVDSGPAHMAAAANTRTVAIFGPTDPRRWRPWGPQHVAVFDPLLADRQCPLHQDCQQKLCLGKLDPELVLHHCLPALIAQRSSPAVEKSIYAAPIQSGENVK